MNDREAKSAGKARATKFKKACPLLNLAMLVTLFVRSEDLLLR